MFGRYFSKFHSEMSSFRYKGTLTWNHLPREGKVCSSKKQFKLKLRSTTSLNDISYLKEAAVISNKEDDFIYF